MDKQARKAAAVTSAAEKPVNKLRSHRCRQTFPPDSIFSKSFDIYSSFRTSLIIDQRRNTSCDWAIRDRKKFSLTFCQSMSTPAHLSWWMGQDDEDVYVPWCRVVIKAPQILTILDLSNSKLGRKWTECIDKEWLRDIEKRRRRQESCWSKKSRCALSTVKVLELLK